MADSNITKWALATSLKELMAEQPFDKINVAQICERCDMNRKSFYYHFKDKYDLVNWIFDTEFITLLKDEKLDVSHSNYKERWAFVEKMCQYFYQNHGFYRKALQIRGQNSFRDHFREYEERHRRGPAAGDHRHNTGGYPHRQRTGAALMPALFEAYVTNLGKYNEGELIGEYLKFPTTPEEVQALLKRIGIDGVRYEEIFITDFDGDVLGLYDHLGEYENIDELNHLACVISELDQGDLEKFEAVIDSGEYTGSVKELINLAQNLDCFEFYPGVTDDETLGRIYVEDMEAIDVPEHLLNYFDYEAYGRDIRLNEDGHYAPGGYVLNNGGSFIEHYHGREDIPDEHKVFSMPKLNIREQMAAYKEVIDRSSLEGERLHPRKEVPER